MLDYHSISAIFHQVLFLLLLLRCSSIECGRRSRKINEFISTLWPAAQHFSQVSKHSDFLENLREISVCLHCIRAAQRNSLDSQPVAFNGEWKCSKCCWHEWCNECDGLKTSPGINLFQVGASGRKILTRQQILCEIFELSRLCRARESFKSAARARVWEKVAQNFLYCANFCWRWGIFSRKLQTFHKPPRRQRERESESVRWWRSGGRGAGRKRQSLSWSEGNGRRARHIVWGRAQTLIARKIYMKIRFNCFCLPCLWLLFLFCKCNKFFHNHFFCAFDENHKDCVRPLAKSCMEIF